MDIVRWLGHKWSDSASFEPAEIIDLRADGAVSRLLADYCTVQWRDEGHDQRRVLRNVLLRAQDSGAKTLVIERRYTDIDYRDEHARFYSRTFRHYASSTHRLHFFLESVPETVTSPDIAANFDSMTYLGYTVLRPVPGAMVGRTMLRVPEKLATPRETVPAAAVTCTAKDIVNFFGTTYDVEAAPFMAQDSQLGSCAHVAAWTVCYFHTRRHGERRVLPGNIVDAVPQSLTSGRSVPTPGLGPEQITSVLERNGIPADVFWMHDSSSSRRAIDKIVRRHLDSALPVIVGTRNPNHAYTLVGYHAPRKRERPIYICQDDEIGPYRLRTRPLLNHAVGAWQYLITPMPPEMYITSEAAEQLGKRRLEHELEEFSSASGSSQAYECRRILKDLPPHTPFKQRCLGFVTSAVRSNEFKRTLIDRGYSEEVARAYMRLPMSKWIWVVELVDLAAFRDRGRAGSVICEALIDSTEHFRDRHVLAWRIPELLRHWITDSDRVGNLDIGSGQPLAASMCATSTPRSC